MSPTSRLAVARHVQAAKLWKEMLRATQLEASHIRGGHLNHHSSTVEKLYVQILVVGKQ